jgi:hypothetical protein
MDHSDIEELHLELDGKVPLFPFQRGEILTKLNRITDLKKLKIAYKSICRMIEDMEEDITEWRSPRNPREDLIQIHNKKALQVLKKQKERQEKRIILLEQQIQKDIEDSKKE